MNPFLSFFDGRDQNGGFLRNYRLNFDIGLFNIFGQGMYLLLQLTYSTLLLPIGAVSTWLMGFVFEPGRILDPATEWYQKVFGPILDVVPPAYLAGVTLAILVVYIVADRRVNSRSLTEDFERLGVGVFLAALVGFLVANPFRVMSWVLDLVPRVMQELSEGTSPDAMVGNVVGSLMAPLTQMLNYGQVLDGACSAQWSSAMNSGGEPSCIDTPGSINAGTLAVAFMGIGVVILMLVFAMIIGIKFLYHLTIGMINWVALVYVAAFSIARRRQFDGLAKGVQRAASHTIMAIILSSFAMIGVAILVGLVGDLSTTSMVPAMMGYVVGFVALNVAALKLSASHGALARALRAETSGFFRQKLGTSAQPLFSGNGDGVAGSAQVPGMRGRFGRRGSGVGAMAMQGVGAAADGLLSGGGGMGRDNRQGGKALMQGPDTAGKGFVTDHAATTPYRRMGSGNTSRRVTRDGGRFRSLLASGAGAAAGAAALYFTGGNVAVAGAAKSASSTAVDMGFAGHDRKVSTADARSDAAAARYARPAETRGGQHPGSVAAGNMPGPAAAGMGAPSDTGPRHAATSPSAGPRLAPGEVPGPGDGPVTPAGTGVTGADTASPARPRLAPGGGTGDGKGVPEPHQVPVPPAPPRMVKGSPGADPAVGPPAPLALGAFSRMADSPRRAPVSVDGPSRLEQPSTGGQGAPSAPPRRSAAEVMREADTGLDRSRGVAAGVPDDAGAVYTAPGGRGGGASLPVPSRMDGSAAHIGPEVPVLSQITAGERGMAVARVEAGYRRMRMLCASEGAPITMSPAEEDQARVVLRSGAGGGQADPVGRSVFGPA